MKLRWWLLWLFASFLAGLGFLACALGLIAEPARADAPLIWGASNTAQMLNSGGLVAKDGSVYPKFTEKNYLAAGAWSIGAAASPTWVASGAGITCSNATTNLPDASASPTALAVTGASGSTAFCYADFTLDISDYNKKLKLAFDQATVTYTASDFRIDVYSCSVAFGAGGACSGTLTRLPLSTDIPTTAGICTAGTSCLPALSGTYRTTFDAPGAASKFIQVQIGLNATSTDQLNLAQIVVGPGVTVQGAAVTQWQSYTPTVVGNTTSANVAQYRRVGDTMQVQGYLTASNTTTTTLSVSLPSGLTINASALAKSGALDDVLGYVTVDGSTYVAGNVLYQSSTTVVFAKTGATSVINGTNTIVSGNIVDYSFTVPVNEWAGSGTVNLAYTANPTSEIRVGTSNGYGSTNTMIRRFTNTLVSLGQDITFADSATAGSSFTVGAPGIYSISYADEFSAAANMGISLNSSQLTTSIASINAADRLVMSTTAGANFTGHVDVTVKLSAGDVIRAHADSNTSGANIVRASFTITKVAVDAGQAVGFKEVVPGVSAGLVSASGVPGNALTPATATAGYVGEEALSHVSTLQNINAVSGTGFNALTIPVGASPAANTISPGDWEITGTIYLSSGAATFTTNYDVYWALSGTSGNAFTGEATGINAWEFTIPAAASPSRNSFITPVLRATYDGTTLTINGQSFTSPAAGLVLKMQVNNWSGTTPQYTGTLRARRVR